MKGLEITAQALLETLNSKFFITQSPPIEMFRFRLKKAYNETLSPKYGHILGGNYVRIMDVESQYNKMYGKHLDWDTLLFEAHSNYSDFTLVRGRKIEGWKQYCDDLACYNTMAYF